MCQIPKPEMEIHIEAPATFPQVMVGCSACNESFYVDVEKYLRLRACPFCMELGQLFATYSIIGVPTMEEVEDMSVSLMIVTPERT